MLFFMVSSRVRSPGRPRRAVADGIVNRNQPSSLPGTVYRAPIGAPAWISTWGRGVFFPFGGTAYGGRQRLIGQRQHHPHGGSLALDRLDLEPPAVVVQDRADDPQTQAGAADLRVDGVGSPEEAGGDLLHVPGRDADAVVADLDGRLAAGLAHAQRDVAAVGGELH